MHYPPPILLVEDDDNDVVLTELAFQASGLSNPFLVVRNGEEAIRYLNGDGIYVERSRYPLPGMMFLDLNMPLRTGFQVLEWLQRHPCSSRLVAIVLTASSNPADIRRAMSLGAIDYRVKPSNSMNLVPMFQELHARWLAPDQAPDALAALPSTVPQVHLQPCQP